jgi:transposase
MKKGSPNIKSHIFMPEEIEKLKEYRDAQKDLRLKMRFLALLLISENIEIQTAAGVLGKSVRTVEGWYKTYLEKGPDALNSFQYKPKQSYLTDEETGRLIEWVKKENPSDTRVIRHYIKEHFGISYCRSAIEKLLKKHGLKRLRPKAVPGNPPSEEEQRKFVREYEKLRESAAEPDSDTVVIFCDAMHLVHQTEPSACWGDPSAPPEIRTNSGRRRLNIIGGCNPLTRELVHETGEDFCNAEKAVIFFDKLQKFYPKANHIKVIADNASYFHASHTQTWLEKNPRVSLNFLPAYAPNLNLIERFWKFAKEKLVKNTYYEKYKTFRCHVFRFLNNISQYKEELESLMTEKFQIVCCCKQ